MSRVLRGVATFGLTLLAACASSHPVPDETLRQGSPRTYDHLLVVTRDGWQMELSHAVIGPDSIRGTAVGDHAGDRVALGHDQVVRVESWDANAHRTGMAVIGFAIDFAAGFFGLVGKLVGCSATGARIC
jgi:hypothetical protein